MTENLARNRFVILWLPVILYAGVIFYLSSRAQVPLPISFPFMDKVLHIIEYGILGLLLCRALKRTHHFAELNKLYMLVMAIALLYGISDEFHQAFVPGRTVSLWDALFDAVGGILGALVYR